jgi:hypothetical protein
MANGKVAGLLTSREGARANGAILYKFGFEQTANISNALTAKSIICVEAAEEQADRIDEASKGRAETRSRRRR